MSKRAHLRAVNSNDMPDQQSSNGVSLRTVVILTVVTTVASQIVIDAYKHFKKKIAEGRSTNPMASALGGYPQLPPTSMPHQGPMFAPTDERPPWASSAPPWQAPTSTERPEPEPNRALSANELAEWQRSLERKERKLEQWEREVKDEQRHLRLVGGA